MSTDPTKSQGSRSVQSTVKLNTGHLRYIAAFIKGRGKGGLLEDQDWIELSCSDEMPEGASGATLQVLWEREVEKSSIRVDGKKQKPLDETILKAVGRWDKKNKKNISTDDEKPSLSKCLDNVKSTTKPKKTSTPNTSSNDIISLLSDDEDIKEEKCDSNDSFDMKFPVFNVGSGNFNENGKKENDTIEKDDLKTNDVASTFNNSNPGTSKLGESSAFKRSHPGSTNDTKRSKLSLLQTQYLGLEKLSESNDLTCYWARKFVESFDSHTQELAKLNKNVRSLVDENRGIRKNTEDMVDQITNAYLTERIKNMKKVIFVQEDYQQGNVDLSVPQDYCTLENTSGGNDADHADHADDLSINVKEEPESSLNRQDQESENEVDPVDEESDS